MKQIPPRSRIDHCDRAERIMESCRRALLDSSNRNSRCVCLVLCGINLTPRLLKKDLLYRIYQIKAVDANTAGILNDIEYLKQEADRLARKQGIVKQNWREALVRRSSTHDSQREYSSPIHILAIKQLRLMVNSTDCAQGYQWRGSSDGGRKSYARLLQWPCIEQ